MRSEVPLRELAALLWRERGMLSVALLCAVVGPVAAMGVPVGAKLVIDQVLGRGRVELLMPIGIVASLAVLLQAAASYGATQAASVAGLRAATRLRHELQGHLLTLPVGYFDATPTGTLVARCLSDTDQVRTLLGPALVQSVSGSITASVAFAILFWLDWRMAAVVAAVLTGATVSLSRGFAALHPAFQRRSSREVGKRGTRGGTRADAREPRSSSRLGSGAPGRVCAHRGDRPRWWRGEHLAPGPRRPGGRTRRADSG
jgi:ABC-type bacteriocin/lantibiotic exporter with double-glycine peptidase domain